MQNTATDSKIQEKKMKQVPIMAKSFLVNSIKKKKHISYYHAKFHLICTP